jgi:hypothetical protein
VVEDNVENPEIGDWNNRMLFEAANRGDAAGGLGPGVAEAEEEESGTGSETMEKGTEEE